MDSRTEEKATEIYEIHKEKSSWSDQEHIVLSTYKEEVIT